jgi:hypothetical protein
MGILPMALLGAWMMTACSLDENPKDQIEEEQLYDTPGNLFRHTVATLYSFIGGNSDGQGLQGTCRGVYDLQTFGSDEALLPTRGVDWYDGGIWQALYKHSWQPGHEVINNSWLYLYKVIVMCNKSIQTILDHYSILSERESMEYYMEAKALRAIYYWYLLDLFGNVPIVLYTDVPINEVMQYKRSEVFEFVRYELEDCLTWLPDRRSVENNTEYYGRVTQAVAAFVLAKLYLNAEVYTNDDWTQQPRKSGKNMVFTINDVKMNAWEACMHYCELLKDLGYRLETEYKDNFAIDNDQSRENIWTIPMDRVLFFNQQQNMCRSYHWRHADAYGFDGENGTSASLTTLRVNHFGEADEDKRFAFNYWPGLVLNQKGVVVNDKEGEALYYYPWDVSMDLTGTPHMETAGARMGKYEVDPDAAQGGKVMDNDIVLFRYADVLLMWAEAKVRNGGDGQAEFDMVRKRAKMPSIPATLDNIYNERLIELAWEGWRRNDMIRFDRYRSEYTGPDAVDESDHHTIVFPIPGGVMDANVNLVQNPGY